MFLYEPPQPYIYFPLAQKYQSSATLLVYSEGDPQRVVSQRTQELGIRTALGARPLNVITMVLRQGMTLSLIGMGIGAMLAFLMLRAMHSVLYGVGSTDFPTLGAVSLLLLAVAFVASYIPALRATKVDPVVALRHE